MYINILFSINLKSFIIPLLSYKFIFKYMLIVLTNYYFKNKLYFLKNNFLKIKKIK